MNTRITSSRPATSSSTLLSKTCSLSSPHSYLFISLVISAAHKKKNTNRFLEFLRQCVIPLTPLLDALVNVAMHGADRTNNLTFASLAITNQIITSISSNVWHNSLFNFRLCMLNFFT